MSYQPYTTRYTLADVIAKYGYDYTIKGNRGYMDCPKCGRKKKVTLDFSKDCYRCVACGLSGYAMSLFAFNEKQIEDISLYSEYQKKEVAYEFHLFMDSGSDTPSNKTTTYSNRQPKQSQIAVASDDRLHQVYSAMAENPMLSLTQKHKQLLVERGLSEQRIMDNGYRSIPHDFSILDDECEQMYQEAGGNNTLKAIAIYLKKNQVKFGLKIADVLIKQNLNLEGVPGFFRFGGKWCFWAVSGILIPVRNHKREIVLWQVRRDTLPRRKDGSMANRYITVSNMALPEHVNEGVCRVHHPLHNATESSSVPVYITEGPLKADIACYLYNSPSVWLAIQGINNTKDLYNNVFKRLLQNGVTQINNALDMDRLTNPNVMENSKKIIRNAEKNGLEGIEKYWGIEYANTVYVSLSLIANANHISIQFQSENIYQKIETLAYALNANHIPYCQYLDENGNLQKEYWSSSTKGIDDYLFSLYN